jgi:hypothetical protein
MLDLGFDTPALTREDTLRNLGYEEVAADQRSALWLHLEWEQTNTGVLLPAMTPLELRFKLAGLKLFLEGRYPSARQIKKELGYDVSGKIKLNGRECQWKHELFHTLHIESFWWKRNLRDDCAAWSLSADWLPYWRRGPRGTLTRIVYRKVNK